MKKPLLSPSKVQFLKLVLYGSVFVALSAFTKVPADYNAGVLREGPSVKEISFEQVFEIYQAKCTHSAQPPIPCYLTEKDLDPKGRADQVLIFRGENTLKGLPLTSSFWRWALEHPEICKGLCNNQNLINYSLKAAQHLPLQEDPELYYRSQDRSWRTAEGHLAPTLARPQHTGISYLAKIHKIGAGLYFEEKRGQLFDPFVSFSLDPVLADMFARVNERQEGVLYVASVPLSKIKFVKAHECSRLSLQVGTLYDLNACTDTVLNDLEIEINAVLYLPSEFFYARIPRR